MDKVRFQLDEHMPHAIAHGLRRRGIDVSTTTDAGLRGLSDGEILLRSQAAGRVVVTHDADFLQLHGQASHAGIAYNKRGTRSIGELIAGLTLIHEILTPDEMANRVEYL